MRDFDDQYWSGCDQRHEFPWEFYDAMAVGGWVGIAIPEEYGGGGRGITEGALVLNRVAASGAAMNGSTALHLTMFGLNPVVKFGSDRLKDTFLPRAAAGDLHVAFGVTEPDAGTDTSRITTRAVDDGMGGFVVSGRKIWTSKALESEVCLLLARTDGTPGDGRFGGLSLFLVDLDPDHVDIGPIPKTRTQCGRLVRGRLRRAAGRGLAAGRRARARLPADPARAQPRTRAAGGDVVRDRRGRASSGRSAYAKERIVFDRPIGANQAIAHPLAEAHMELQAAYDHDARSRLALRPRPRVRRAGQHREVSSPPRRAGSPPTRRVQTHGGLGYADRVPRRAVLARGAPAAARAGQPGDDVQLHRPERAGSAAQLLIASAFIRSRPRPDRRAPPGLLMGVAASASPSTAGPFATVFGMSFGSRGGDDHYVITNAAEIERLLARDVPEADRGAFRTELAAAASYEGKLELRARIHLAMLYIANGDWFGDLGSDDLEVVHSSLSGLDSRKPHQPPHLRSRSRLSASASSCGT